MIRPRLFACLLVFTLGFSAGLPLPARAENPLEKLHKKLFGDDDDKKDNKKKKDKDKDRDRDRDKEREREKEQERERERRRLQDERPRDGLREGDRRIYVEPAPRSSYERRYDRYEPASRYDSRSRPIEVDVQLALRRNGYYRGQIDGSLGEETRDAIRDYQYDRRLPVTGRIDNYLVRSLGL